MSRAPPVLLKVRDTPCARSSRASRRSSLPNFAFILGPSGVAGERPCRETVSSERILVLDQSVLEAALGEVHDRRLGLAGRVVMLRPVVRVERRFERGEQ